MSTMPAGSSVNYQIPLPLAGQRGPAERDRVRGVDLHAVSLPAREFTGDFFFSHRTGDTLWITVGDVAGKGLDAAVIMAMIQEELEHRITSCAKTACDPAITMRRLHDLLRPILPSNKFATLVIAQIRDDGRLVIVNGGHPPPLIARRDGEIEQIASTGPAAGILDDSSWRSTVRNLAPDETLLLYTDGIIEANDFGVSGLVNAFRKAASLPNSREIANAVTVAIRKHGGIEDDLTLLVARR